MAGRRDGRFQMSDKDDFTFGFNGFRFVGDHIEAKITVPFYMSYLDQYEICKKRGHQPSGYKALSNPPWDICKHCGAYYHYEQVLKEL